MTEKKLKKRIQRCLGILTTVLSRKGINRKVLAAEYQCSTRQISDDLNLLREIGFPIRYERQGFAFPTSDNVRYVALWG